MGVSGTHTPVAKSPTSRKVDKDFGNSNLLKINCATGLLRGGYVEKMQSAFRMVLRRWAMTILVTPSLSSDSLT